MGPREEEEEEEDEEEKEGGDGEGGGGGGLEGGGVEEVAGCVGVEDAAGAGVGVAGGATEWDSGGGWGAEPAFVLGELVGTAVVERTREELHSWRGVRCACAKEEKIRVRPQVAAREKCGCAMAAMRRSSRGARA